MGRSVQRDNIMKIEYEADKYNSSYRKISKIKYCCDGMKAEINPKYITEALINNIKKKCPYCGAKIELIEVK